MRSGSHNFSKNPRSRLTRPTDRVDALENVPKPLDKRSHFQNTASPRSVAAERRPTGDFGLQNQEL